MTTIVHKAVSSKDPSEIVAIKEYRPSHLPISDAMLAKVLAEAHLHYSLGVALSHPNILRTRTLLNHRFIVTDWIDGPTLRGLLGLPQPLSAKLAIEVCLHIACSLGYLTLQLHGRFPEFPFLGHGDIHLDNVMVAFTNGKPRPCLIDLCNIGRSLRINRRTVSEVERELRHAGNGVAQSPEYIFGLTAFPDTCSDVFSLGVLLYWLLFRCSPFAPQGYLERLRLWYHGRFLAISVPTISGSTPLPNALRHLLTGMLAFDRDDRVASTAHVELELRGIIDSIDSADLY